MDYIMPVCLNDWSMDWEYINKLFHARAEINQIMKKKYNNSISIAHTICKSESIPIEELNKYRKKLYPH